MKTCINSFSPGPTHPIPNQARRFIPTILLAAAVLIPHFAFAAGPSSVNLGTSARFLILSGQAITSTGGGFIAGDVGASPITGSAIGLNAVQVSGTIFTVDAGGPAGSVVNPGLLTIAKADLTTAYNDAAARIPAPSGSFLNPGSGNLGGLNLLPGLYGFSSSALLTGGNLTLSGGPDDVWIFQIASSLQVDPGMQVILVGGARAANVFWQVGSSATLGTSSSFKGTIMADQSITMNASSILEGRALASIAAVTFNGQGISLPASIGDFVWSDLNLNGSQETNEPGVSGVVVNLYDGDSNLTATITSDSQGLYGFTNLVPGAYFLEFMKPAGSFFTLQNQGPVGLESRADSLTGRTTNFTVFAGQHDPTWDAGLVTSNSTVQMLKTAGTASDGAILYVQPGANVTYTFQVNNLGTTFLANVMVTDSVLGTIGTIPMLAPGESIVMTAVQSNIVADVVNVATVQGTPAYANGDFIAGLDDVTDSDDADTRIDLVIPSAPHIAKAANLDPVMLKQLLVYTITVSNTSLSAVASNVMVVESYDPYFRYRSASPSPMAGTSNLWDLGDLPPGFVTNIVITGRVNSQASLVNGLLNSVELFSDFGNRTTNVSTRVIDQIPIPVTLVSFRAVTRTDGVLLKWETATEFDNLGFNLLRSDSASGQRVRVNARLVPGANSTDGQTYRFLDATARPGATCYYWLEEVAANFKTATYGPAIRAGSGTLGQPAVAGSFRTASTGGLYRIRYDALAAAGVPLDCARLTVRIAGVAVPLIVNASGPMMQPGDSLLFYAPASSNGLVCGVSLKSNPARMALADAHPVHAPGDVYLAQAGQRQRIRFLTDPAIVRTFLIDYTDAPVWVLDVTRPMKPILLNGCSYVGLTNGLTGVYLSYNPEAGPARCFAVQDAAIMDVPLVLWR